MKGSFDRSLPSLKTHHPKIVPRKLKKYYIINYHGISHHVKKKLKTYKILRDEN